MLITFEGINGLGKTTQIDILKDWGSQQSISVKVIKARKSPLIEQSFEQARSSKAFYSEHLLYAAGLYEQAETALENTEGVIQLTIADRWSYSAIARGRLRDMDVTWLRAIYSQLTIPDLVFLFKAEPSVGLYRIQESSRKLTCWEAGQDIYPNFTQEASFILTQSKFQNFIKEEIDREVNVSSIRIIDSTLDCKTINGQIIEHLKCFSSSLFFKYTL